MYAVTRRYQFDPNENEEINRQVQEGLVPLIRPVSVFEDKVGAEESVRLTTGYEQKHLAALLGKPSITRGEVRAHAWRETSLS